MSGKWKGLQGIVNDQEVVWPPMVIIQNTLLDQDDNKKVCYVSFKFICTIHIFMELMHLERHGNLKLQWFDS